MAKEKEVKKGSGEMKNEMTLQEAKEYRASLHRPEKRTLNDQEKRDAFRIYWAQAKRQYGKSKDIEEILWVHLKSAKMDEPEQFEAGISHFGLKKI